MHQPPPTQVSVDSTTSTPPAHQEAMASASKPKELSPEQKRRIAKQRELMAEIIFPAYVARKCMPKVDGLGKLLSLMQESKSSSSSTSGSDEKDKDVKETNAKGTGSNSNYNRPAGIDMFSEVDWERIKDPQPGPNALSDKSPWNHVEQIDKSCNQFKVKHLQAKVKALNAQKTAIELTKEAEAMVSSSSSDPFGIRQQQNQAAQTFEEEKARALIHEMNYKFCLSQVSCPERMNRLVACWGAVGPVNMKRSAEAGQEGKVCSKQKEAVERCSGALVQRSMQVAIEE